MRAFVLVGPTAVGKSDVAQWIAEKLGVPILSADSMLVYRGMDVGTAKPTPAERGSVPYFGIDCVEAGAPFSTGAWLAFVRRQMAAYEEGKRAMTDGEEKGIGERKKSPISHPPSPISYLASGGAEAPQLVVAGGTGLYVRALLGGLDAPPSDPAARAKWTNLYHAAGRDALLQAVESRPEARALLSPDDLQNPRRLIRALERADAGEMAPGGDGRNSGDGRTVFGQPVAGLLMPRDRLAARIAARIDKMFKAGLVEEAVALRAAGGLSDTAAGAIGYAEALAVADGLLSPQEARERIAARTRQLAKRQMTWFRHQLKVEWVDVAEGDTPATLGTKVMEVWKRHGHFEV